MWSIKACRRCSWTANSRATRVRCRAYRLGSPAAVRASAWRGYRAGLRAEGGVLVSALSCPSIIGLRLVHKLTEANAIAINFRPFLLTSLIYCSEAKVGVRYAVFEKVALPCYKVWQIVGAFTNKLTSLFRNLQLHLWRSRLVLWGEASGLSERALHFVARYTK
jgi:hypothetical protein